MLPQAIMSGSITALTSAGIVPNYTTSESGNPFIAGWYADPDASFLDSQYWVFPTSSRLYDEQTYLDAFSSPDLVHWIKHANIITTADISWARRAVWAPCVVERDGLYYLYFGANDIQPGDGQVGGIGVARADRPEGPYRDALGRPLIGDYYHGAQPIDQDVFVDDDGQAYIYYGGHSHASMAKLNADMVSLGSFTYEDGSSEVFRDVTPPGYVEGAGVFKRQGRYYMMWSEGGWGGPDYAVAYGMADTPLGPFERVAKVLEQDPAVATGSGHNAVLNVPGTDIWYIVYHRRPLSETDQNHRVVCYDRMYFDDEGKIRPVKMLVRDKFEDGLMIAWKTYGDQFEVRDGAMVNVAQDDATENVDGLALLDTNFTDLVYDADVRLLDDANKGASLLFRVDKVNGDDNTDYQGYSAGISAHAHMVFVDKASNGSLELVNTAPITVELGKTYRIRVTAIGSEIKVFVDDMVSPRVTANDSAFLSGRNGVQVRKAMAAFDNIAIDKA